MTDDEVKSVADTCRVMLEFAEAYRPDEDIAVPGEPPTTT